VEDRRGRADVYRDRERTTTTTAVYAIAHVWRVLIRRH
jgi:hypothetical protein